MKKALKICGIVVLILALATNLQYAVLSHYGITNSNLGAQLWAQTNSTSTSPDGSESSGGGGSDSGDDSNGEEARRYVKTTQSVTCTNFTANITYNTSSSGTSGISLGLGTLGTYSLGLNSGHSSSGGTTITNYNVTYPTNPNGTPMSFQKVWCSSGGSDRCNSSDPCLSMALGQIDNAINNNH